MIALKSDFLIDLHDFNSFLLSTRKMIVEEKSCFSSNMTKNFSLSFRSFRMLFNIAFSVSSVTLKERSDRVSRTWDG